MPENGVFSCVPFCLGSLSRFERCVTAIATNYRRTIESYIGNSLGTTLTKARFRAAAGGYCRAPSDLSH